MKSFALLAFTVGLIQLAPTNLVATEPKKPNVLFIIADDLNRHLPCYGHKEVIAPNVDRLAEKSIRFDRAYCQYPVCSPSRVSFMSGRRPEHTGMYGNEGASRTPLLKDAVFLPEHFKANGYFTARVGKVFHIGRDVPESWDITEEGTPDNKIIYQPSEIEKLSLMEKVKSSGKLQGGGGEGNSWSILDAPDDDLIDGRIGRRVSELISKSTKGNKPFFITCGFRRPHLPRIAPAQYFEKYPLAKIELTAKSPVVHPLIKEAPSDADTREALRSYYSCVSFMDAQLGRVLDALDQHKLWDDTIIVLIGDHGYALGSRGGWWGKNQGYEDNCGTCCLVHTPGRSAGIMCKRVVELLDLYPTLADLCGLPNAVGVEGRSLKPLLDNPTAIWNHAAYSVISRDGKPTTLAVSVERYRLIGRYDGTGPAELYDVQADPNEWVNVIDDPAHATGRSAMTTLADRYRSSIQTSGRK